MPPEDEGANDAAATRRIRLPGAGLEDLFPNLRFGLKGLGEIGECLRPLTDPLAVFAAPFVQMAGLVAQTTVGLGMKKWAVAESLMARGWVPNLTTPFDLVERCEDDYARLNEALLAHYSENWRDVRARLEASVSSCNVDDDAKARFREALDCHERGSSHSVSRLLFPEIERVLRKALFDEKAVGIRHGRLARKLAEESGQIKISAIPAGIQGMAMFRYLTGGTRASRSDGSEPRYAPRLYAGINEENLDDARRSPVPTRHAVVHGLVDYSSQQSSLNTLFIADYAFSIISEVSRLKAECAARAA